MMRDARAPRARAPLLVAVIALLAALAVPAAADDSSAAEYSVVQGRELRMSTGIPAHPNLLNAIESGQAVLVLLIDQVPSPEAAWSSKPYSFVTHRFAESAGAHDITVGYKPAASGDLVPTATHRVTVSGSTTDCTVSFDANGGDLGPVKPRTVRSGTTIALPASGPTREGWDFSGWARASPGGHVFPGGAMYTVTVDITFYAHWSHDCTVSFDANGGDLGPVRPLTVEIGSVIALPVSGPTLAGFSFVGWSLGSPGGQILHPGTGYIASGDVTFFARWAPASETLRGDVDLDGYVDIGDLYAFARLLSGDAPALSGQARINADLDGDGEVGPADSTLLAQEILLGSWVCGDADLDGEVTARDLALAVGHMGGKRLHGQSLSNIDCDKNLAITQSDIDTIRVLASASLPEDDPEESGSGGIPWWIIAAVLSLALACIAILPRLL